MCTEAESRPSTHIAKMKAEPPHLTTLAAETSSDHSTSDTVNEDTPPNQFTSLVTNETDMHEDPSHIVIELDDSAAVLEPGAVSPIKRRHESYRECPECQTKMFHLPRHMVQIHEWPKEKAAKISSILGIRKVKGTKTKQLKRKSCTVEGCYAQVYRLGQHMLKVHGITNSQRTFYGKKKASKESITEESRKQEQGQEVNNKSQDKDEDLFSDDQMEVEQQNKEVNNKSQDKGEDLCSDDQVEVEQQNKEDIMSDHWNGIFNSYENFLKGPAGGSLDEKTVLYNTGRLRKLIRELKVENVEELLVEEKLWNYFGGKAKQSDGWRSQTIITYLTSLKKFFSFIAKKRKDSPFSHLEIAEAENLCSILPGWSRSYYKISGEERRVKRREQQELLLNKEKVERFYSSKPYRDAVKIIGELDDKYPLTRTEFALVKNILIFILLMKNAKRGGIFSEMRISEFLDRERIEDRIVISVGKHKTSYAHDEANLVLTTTENTYFESYYKFMRPKVATDVSGDYFFLNWGGNPTSASNVSAGIKQIGITSGLGKMIPNIFRKSASTNVYYHFPEMAENVACHMDHDILTAKHAYRLLNKKRTAVPSVKAIEAAHTCEKSPYSKLLVEATLPSETNISTEDETKIFVASKKSTTEGETEVTEADSEDESPSVTSASSKGSFSYEANRLIEKIFMDKINKGVDLSSKTVRNILKEKTPKLLSQYGEKKLLAKVRWLLYKSRRMSKKEVSSVKI